jgi:hypothetical protein
MEKHRRTSPYLRVLPAVVVAALALAAACGKKEPPLDTRLYGYWEGTTRDMFYHIGTGLEIFPGDSVVRVMARMADRPYIIEGDQLTLDLRRPDQDTLPLDTSNTKTYTFSFTQDTLVRTFREAVGWYVRFDDYMIDSQSILGTWQMVRTSEPTLDPAVERFTPEGVLYARIFQRSQPGTYVVAGDTLMLAFTGQDTLRFIHRLSGDSLFLKLGDGADELYLRAGTGNWYAPQSP